MAQRNSEGDVLLFEAFERKAAGHQSTFNVLVYTVSLARESIRLDIGAKNTTHQTHFQIFKSQPKIYLTYSQPRIP